MANKRKKNKVEKYQIKCLDYYFLGTIVSKYYEHTRTINMNKELLEGRVYCLFTFIFYTHIAMETLCRTTFFIVYEMN